MSSCLMWPARQLKSNPWWKINRNCRILRTTAGLWIARCFPIFNTGHSIESILYPMNSTNSWQNLHFFISLHCCNTWQMRLPLVAQSDFAWANTIGALQGNFEGCINPFPNMSVFLNWATMSAVHRDNKQQVIEFLKGCSGRNQLVYAINQYSEE